MRIIKEALETIILSTVGVMLGILLMTIINSDFKYKFFPVALPSTLSPTPTPSPFPKPIISKTKATSDSPDSLKSLILEKTDDGKNVTYQSTVLNKNDTTTTFLFTKIGVEGYQISIPYNTWSPDDKYFFINESYKNFSVWDIKNQTSSNITDLFQAKYPDLVLSDVTGWASPNLLIVNTRKLDGRTGPSLWFNVENNSFIVLATRFN